MKQPVSWIHFGDLHISSAAEKNYLDFGDLIEDANRMWEGIAFGLLPGDNADDGESDQYALIAQALSRCRFPVHVITGDHDVANGTLRGFQKSFPEALPRSLTIGPVHFVLLNSVCERHPPDFGFGSEQMKWLRNDVASVRGNEMAVVVFMHAYPSEHPNEATELGELLQGKEVMLVEMGHTHYNELANDGHTIYAATRSTGQIEEGPVGYSVSTIDNGVVSWHFKRLREWPWVMITSPGDQRLIVDPGNFGQLVRGTVLVRARVWGKGTERVTMSIDGRYVQSLLPTDDSIWSAPLDSTHLADGPHVLAVTSTGGEGEATDRITVLVNQQGQYLPPPRHPRDYENTVGEWRDKHILGTQLGPNENGHPWPSRRERELSAS